MDNYFTKCDVCVEAKHAKKPFTLGDKRDTILLELIHTKFENIKRIPSRGGEHYYITFVDHYSMYTIVYLLRAKDETEEMFNKYKFKVENQLDRKIKRIR